MPLQVDLDNIDLKEFPRVENLDFMDCILEEGDLLYIPPKWWHYVRSLSISFSISFWWRKTLATSSAQHLIFGSTSGPGLRIQELGKPDHM